MSSDCLMIVVPYNGDTFTRFMPPPLIGTGHIMFLSCRSVRASLRAALRPSTCPFTFYLVGAVATQGLG